MEKPFITVTINRKDADHVSFICGGKELATVHPDFFKSGRYSAGAGVWGACNDAITEVVEWCRSRVSYMFESQGVGVKFEDAPAA